MIKIMNNFEPQNCKILIILPNIENCPSLIVTLYCKNMTYDPKGVIVWEWVKNFLGL